MAKFKVGDKVTIRSDLKEGMCSPQNITYDMLKYLGKTVKITWVNDCGVYNIDMDNGVWNWNDDMFEEEVSEITIGYIFNNILDGEVYASKEDRSRMIKREGSQITILSLDCQFDLEEKFEKVEILELKDVVIKANIDKTFYILGRSRIYRVNNDLDLIDEDGEEITENYSLGDLFNKKFIKA